MHCCSTKCRPCSAAIGMACAALAGALIAGCATYQAAPAVPATVARAFEARRLDDPRLETLIESLEGAPASSSWDLRQLTIAGIYYSPALDVARAKWRVSRAAIVTAASRPNPSLDASAGWATNAPAGEPHALADLRAGIPIETAGKREDRIAAAQRLSEAARLGIRSTAWKVRAGIRDALLDWSAAKKREAILAREVAARQSMVEMVGRRVALGAASSTDEALERAALARARLDRAGAEAQAERAKTRLAAAIGIPAHALDAVAIRFPDAPPSGAEGDRAQLRRDALLRRTDVRAALERHAAAESDLRLEIAKQYPDVEIGPGYAYDTGTNKFSFGIVGLKLPLLDRNQGPIAEAKARRDQAAREFEALQDGVLGELDQAIADAASARHGLVLADAGVAAEQARFRRFERRFEAGEEDRLALATSRAAVSSAQLSRAAAALALEQALGRLEDATQTPLFDAGFDALDARIVEGTHP